MKKHLKKKRANGKRTQCNEAWVHWCAAVGCSNSCRKLKQWKESCCVEHDGLLHTECPCPVPYQLHRFPVNKAMRRRWMAAINRKDLKPKPHTRVCSIHFKDGRPTKRNPVPSLNLRYKIKLFKRRRPFNSTTTTETQKRPARRPLKTASQQIDDDPRAPVTFRWKDHGYHLVAGLVDLFRRGSQVDANVTFNGILRLKAHRLIMSVFMPFVENYNSPVDLDLQSVAEESDDVGALIEFIYTGQMTVSKDRIEPLRRLAEALHFEGLLKTIDGDDDDLCPPFLRQNEDFESNSASHVMGFTVANDYSDLPVNMSVKKEVFSGTDVTNDFESIDVTHQLPVVEICHDIEAGDKSTVTVLSTGFQCDRCHEVFTQTDKHCRSDIDGRELYVCDSCSEAIEVTRGVVIIKTEVVESMDENDGEYESEPLNDVGGPESEIKEDIAEVTCKRSNENPALPSELCSVDEVSEACDVGLHGDYVQEEQKSCEYQQCLQAFLQSEHLHCCIDSVRQCKGPFRCQQCSKMFSRTIQLMRHVRLKHQAPD